MTSKLMLAAVALLLAASLIGIPLVGTQIHATADQVILTPTTYMGDLAMLEGLTVQTDTTLNDRLYWTTNYTPATGASATAYDFALFDRSNTDDRVATGVRLENGFHYGYSFHGSLSSDTEADATGLLGVYNRLYRETPNGERREMTVRLADYYTYYPITGRIDFGHTSVYLDWEDAHLNYTPMPDSARYIGWRMNQYFKLPLLGDESVTVSIDKSGDGNSVDIGSSTSSPEYAVERVNYVFSTASVVLDDLCYFTIDGLDSTYTPIDTSHIEGGYGIYTIATRNGRIDADSITNVYPLDIAEGNPIGIYASADARQLLLYRVRGHALTLTVLDRASMTPIQTLTVADRLDLEWSIDFEPNGNFHVITVGYDRLLLVDVDAAGKWTLRLDLPIDSETLALSDERLSAFLRYHYPTRVLAWDGRRLVVGELFGLSGHRDFSPCALYLAVLTADGLAYLGLHESSLNCPTDLYNSQKACWPVALRLNLPT